MSNYELFRGGSINAHGVVSKVHLTHIDRPCTVADSYYSCTVNLCLNVLKILPDLVRYLISFSPNHRKQIANHLSPNTGI